MKIKVPTFNPPYSDWHTVSLCGPESKILLKRACVKKGLMLGLTLGAAIEAAGNGELGEDIFNVPRYDSDTSRVQRPMAARIYSPDSYKRFKAACVEAESSQSRVLTLIIEKIYEGEIELEAVQAKDKEKLWED